ncbi:MAG: FKBP-type peptidyl-prolyl cis-trans isomerase [Bacteroidetes bacterium]|nr:FKBP-type peptidyl-prolyl cis-trans isomerase [Bacteroidota bacterium]MDA1119019.1 FKBP-type peptidyl-prolyl cis-trans isomerase [Bacteroidota bacterium]
MKNIKSVLWVLSLIAFACGSGEETVQTAGGVQVKFVTKGDGEIPVHGEILTMNIAYSDEKGKVLFQTENGPVPMMFDTMQWKAQGLLYEVLSLLKAGDSVSFQIPAKDLFEKSFQVAVPDSIPSESLVSFKCGLVEVTTMEAYVSKQESGQLQIDSKIIEDFLTENQIETQTTSSGLRYVITNEGTGRNAQAGDNVLVHYHGTLLDGTKFDSSYDRGDPFSFVLGQGRVIRGWDEGIALLNTGAKATLYIPSSLAYGSSAAGEQIGPNSILKFDVELVEIQ